MKKAPPNVSTGLVQQVRYLLFAVAILTATLVVEVGEVLAAECFVRPAGGSYGLEDGSSYENAWDGFVNIDWAQLGVGDTLWLVGTFDENLTVDAGGDAGSDLTIRGDHAQGDGIFAVGRILLWSGGHDYITLYGLTFLDGRIDYADDAGPYTSNTMVFSDYTLTDAAANFVAAGFESGMNLRVNGLGSPNLFSFRIESVTPTQMTISEGYPRGAFLYHDTSVTGDVATIRGVWPNHNITIDGCDITTGASHSASKLSIKSIGDELTITNTRFSGDGKRRSGLFYITCRDYYDVHDGITITENHFSDIGGPDGEDSSDNHCIGTQGAENVVISGNVMTGCGAAFVNYSCGGRWFRNWEITDNVITGMDYERAPLQWGGSGIVLSGSGTGSDDGDGLIANNIIAHPLNCPSNDSSVACLGIHTKVEKEARIYNNTIIGHDKGISLGNAYNVDIRNTIDLNPNLYHVDMGTLSGTAHAEDYCIYSPDSGTRFKYLSFEQDLVNYSSEIENLYAITGINSHTLSVDPVLDSGTYIPLWNSPAIDNGTDSGIDTDHRGNPLYGPPDIGAIEYQPPYTMGTDEVDITGNVRVYGDGTFRNKETAGGTTVDLSVTPTSNNTREYLDIEITEWNTTDTYRKTWTETSDTVTGSVTHTIGDLQPNTAYEVSVDGTPGADITGCTNGVCTANGSGEITFTYTGTYSTHTFDVQETTRGTTLSADFNADDTVNIFDYNLLLTHFGATADCGNPADANGDCAVNIFDYNVLLGEFGRSV